MTIVNIGIDLAKNASPLNDDTKFVSDLIWTHLENSDTYDLKRAIGI